MYDGREINPASGGFNGRDEAKAAEALQLATEASPSGSLLVDDKGRIVLVNAHVRVVWLRARRADWEAGRNLVPKRFAPSIRLTAPARARARDGAGIVRPKGWQ